MGVRAFQEAFHMNAITLLSVLPLILLLASPRSSSPAGGGGVVVVELFTSQGCSSCPPADRLLSRLANDPKYRGRVIPLSFHVDYWNHIGWIDPYSSPKWSERQRAYAARTFRSNRIYTPQTVFNGREECVGSRDGDVTAKIESALAAEPAGRVSLKVEPLKPNSPLRVTVGAKLARESGAENLDLWVAVYQNNLATEVGSGENASRTLKNDRVVRRFEKALTLPGTAGTERSTELVLGIDKRWPPESLGVAAFLQDPATLAIHGAAAYSIRRP
jgi:hypothetical protein